MCYFSHVFLFRRYRIISFFFFYVHTWAIRLACRDKRVAFHSLSVIAVYSILIISRYTLRFFHSFMYNRFNIFRATVLLPIMPRVAMPPEKNHMIKSNEINMNSITERKNPARIAMRCFYTGLCTVGHNV